jgi:hypothetical protein
MLNTHNRITDGRGGVVYTATNINESQPIKASPMNKLFGWIDFEAEANLASPNLSVSSGVRGVRPVAKGRLGPEMPSATNIEHKATKIK